MESYIWTLLNGHLYSDAIRLAEIYHAEVNTEDSLYYVALCYFKSKKINSSYQILSRANCNQSKSRLLLGQCCFELSKYQEAERAFLGNDIKLETIHNNNNNNFINNNNNNSTSTTTTNNNNNNTNATKDQLVKLYGNDSNAAIAAKYVGSIFEKTSRFKEAAEFFKISLELFPYMWGSAEALARLTDKTSTFQARTNFLANALGKAKLDNKLIHQLDNSHIHHNNNYHHHNITTANYSINNTNQIQLASEHKQSSTNNSITTSRSAIPALEYKTPQTRRVPGPVKKEPRRSTRLYSIENNNETPATNVITTRNSAIANTGTNAPAKKMRRADPELNNLDATAKIFLESFRAIDCLNQYKLDLSISIFNGLPTKHRNSGWVLSNIARALYEKTDYNESVKYYEAARKLEPYRLEGMEYYSSALWHLHKEVELSILARELMNFDQDAPETWCVAGNCYSLQKEHETAIKYLEKAIKVDPNFAYAHTLLGHELISAERLDQATTCFRNAVRLDPRHWNAWCGLGCIYYKNEVYVNAELYYKKALKIAPTNPVLMCQLAVVQHACKKSDIAIDTLSRALTIDPDNALCRFHRATIYSAIDKNMSALNELNELKRLVPKESMVYFLIGKIHKKTGNTHTALMNFSWAMELDPKGANNTIRDVIDKQHSGDDDVVVHIDQCVDA